MTISDQGRTAETLKAAADRAMMASDPRAARELFDQAVALTPGRFDLWVGLAAACRGAGDTEAAVGALDQALSIEPRSFPALLMKATLLERLGAPHQAGAAYGIALSQLPPADQMPPQMRAAADRAKTIHVQYEAAMAQALRGDLSAMKVGAGGPAKRRLDQFIDQLAGRRKIYHQEPVLFHYPGLPEIEFLDREDLPFMAEFEARTPQIQAELAGVLDDDADQLEPYINYPPNVPLDQWTELNRSPRWSGYHLLLNGERVENHCRRCPRTMDAITLLPQPTVSRRSPAAMFSVLQPRTRIPPHHGVANTRLVLHLPLVMPPGCGFRVGNETREWKIGQGWVFDDTIEHEAWNDSDQVRTILICDIWNPRLAEEERAMVAAVMAAMDAFSGGARDTGL
jgi:aspartate beta-hydroxylase